MAQFFYDKQIRRFVTQFVRVFSQFFVEYGKDQDGNTTLYRVPVRYADTNKQVSGIIQNNSENTLTTVPIMVCYIDSLRYDRDRIQNPTHVDSISVRQRATNPATGELLPIQKQAFTVDRLMPVPYRLTMKMEVWTSNFDQKLQIYEQILTIFNPALEIQSTDNYLDWTSLSYVLLSDVNWTTRNIPIGTDDPLDVGTLTFEVPIWLSAPAKLKKLGVIQQIVDSVYDSTGNLDESILNQSILTAHRQYFTPLGYNVIVVNGNAQLVKAYGPVINTGDLEIPETPSTPISWQPLIDQLGGITDGISLVYLRDSVTDHLVVGTIAQNPTNLASLLFNVDPDTIPSNSLPSVTSIIDPKKVGPGAGLPAAGMGQVYLILEAIGDATVSDQNQPTAWRNADGSMLFANANDIISWDGSRWNVIFDSQNRDKVEYVTNIYSGVQYKWSEGRWVKSWEGFYNEGFWSIVI